VKKLAALAPVIVASVLIAPLANPVSAQEVTPKEYRVLATSRTGTMEKELSAAASAGFQFDAVMGGETAVGGNETVIVMSRRPDATAPRFQYRLLATNRTGTMQKELQEAADAGFEYRGQTVFNTAFGGREVIVILERDLSRLATTRWEYRLLATSRTSTMEGELQEAGAQGYEVVGLTVAETAVRGKELVTITRRPKP
jgi:hypothetical protein